MSFVACPPTRVLSGEGVLEELTLNPRRKFWLIDEQHQTHPLLQTLQTIDHPEPVIHLLPAGETAKSVTVWLRVIEHLSAAGLQRNDLLVAVGGGSVGDLGGFTAATWQRGMSFAQVPTTLLAMVDSAYGGKSALNFAGVKNQVGLFYYPEQVILDFRWLYTLSAADWRSGKGEILKTALLRGGEYWETVNRWLPGSNRVDALTEDVIRGAVQTKLALVRQDPLDRNIRHRLNLGHTFAHAMESESGPGSIAHGDCVSWGLLAAAWQGHFLGLTPMYFLRELEKLVSLLQPEVPPVSHDAQRLLRWMTRDKKNRSSLIHLIIPQSPGQVKQIEVEPVSLIKTWHELFRIWQTRPSSLSTGPT